MGRGRNPHKFEPVTDYCINCGCSRIDDTEGFRPHCDEVGNVVGISHLILLKRWRLDENHQQIVAQSSAPQSRKS